MIPLDSLVSARETASPQVISHYNLFRSVEIDGSAVPGHSSSQGIADMEKVSTSLMMPGMTYSWTGLTQEEIESSGKAIIIFALGILVVYLTLSAQYESFALPFIILLAVPMAVLGALGAVAVRGLSDDVYCQIGLVMLIGLSAKNAILIVEFAEQLRAQGRTIADAAIEAAELRLQADPDDLVRLHPWRHAAGFRHRSRRARPSLRRHHHCWRYARFDSAESDLHSRSLRHSEHAAVEDQAA
jgi:HAE1 family hydrophobic/amphiphilic exporter-1